MCKHYWLIRDSVDYHQVGHCASCGDVCDFGPNPTIVTDGLIFTTDYLRSPFSHTHFTLVSMTTREYHFPEIRRGYEV